MENIGFKCVYKTGNKKIKKFCNRNNNNDYFNISNVVYKFTCSCKKIYYGETGRRLIVRILEHLNVKTLNNKSVIAKHIIENNCSVNRFNFSIIKSFGKSPKYHRKIFEGILINRSKTNLQLLNVTEKINNFYDVWL